MFDFLRLYRLTRLHQVGNTPEYRIILFLQEFAEERHDRRYEKCDGDVGKEDRAEADFDDDRWYLCDRALWIDLDSGIQSVN